MLFVRNLSLSPVLVFPQLNMKDAVNFDILVFDSTDYLSGKSSICTRISGHGFSCAKFCFFPLLPEVNKNAHAEFGFSLLPRLIRLTSTLISMVEIGSSIC